MVVFAGQGDARRSMSLLWRSPGSAAERSGPGPKPALTVDRIVDAAIGLADAEGLAAVSMRAVGRQLGRSGMALYTYVPNKGELVELMYDKAHAELAGEYEPDGGWRRAVTAWAEDLCGCYQRHPWLLQVSQARPVLGPHEFAVLEALLRALHGTGLSARELRSATSALFHLVRGAARTIADAHRAGEETGVAEDAWWYDRSARLDEVAPDFAERFPHLVRMESEDVFTDDSRLYVVQSAQRAFTDALAMFLDGVEAAVDRR
ncbi:TetR/AcrR family transcriptional regulator [Saccharopolyspora cebuensis]|uniref:TetR/AcrR family transcriptional regulator n=1 Tax=Saccharopolyspora cebuensis TaxID=418759 RepID=A0ABV4CQ77_9PSEU